MDGRQGWVGSGCVKMSDAPLRHMTAQMVQYGAKTGTFSSWVPFPPQNKPSPSQGEYGSPQPNRAGSVRGLRPRLGPESPLRDSLPLARSWGLDLAPTSGWGPNCPSWGDLGARPDHEQRDLGPTNVGMLVETGIYVGPNPTLMEGHQSRGT